MKKNLRTAFSTRQYMLSKDFELYYYSDTALAGVSAHTHDYYEFYFFLEGDVEFEIEGRRYPVTFGDIMVMPPRVSHRPFIRNTRVPYRRFVLWISREYCEHLMDISADYGYLIQYVQLKKIYLFHNDRVTFNTVQSKILRLLEELHADRFGRGAQVTLCVNDLILHINRLIYAKNHPKEKDAEISLYQKISAYIEEHLDEDLSLDRLSEIFFVSKYHIAHIFKNNLGMSIHQYITKKRLTLCREAILGSMNITDVYLSYGFGDYSSFYRAFKKEYGVSPKDFKDMQTVKYDQ